MADGTGNGVWDAQPSVAVRAMTEEEIAEKDEIRKEKDAEKMKDAARRPEKAVVAPLGGVVLRRLPPAVSPRPSSTPMSPVLGHAKYSVPNTPAQRTSPGSASSPASAGSRALQRRWSSGGGRLT